MIYNRRFLLLGSTVFDCRGALARVEGLFNPATSDLVTGR